ncbi:mitogen-activated protein kinase kinase kinase YODA [Artemisia annua]|uniref:Mitogen-activated protein kinase kinase kinase YODA n=1 Tax=Artemisia annua TaxID=35608 RepID=A0A2U1NJ37_ARTAN|nr:mitogen-activated protein kinase kinase kinase YODA [Artemisia annua]
MNVCKKALMFKVYQLYATSMVSVHLANGFESKCVVFIANWASKSHMMTTFFKILVTNYKVLGWLQKFAIKRECEVIGLVVKAATKVTIVQLSTKFVEKLASKPPVVENRIKLLQDIASEFLIQWDSKAFKQRMDKPSRPAQVWLLIYRFLLTTGARGCQMGGLGRLENYKGLGNMSCTFRTLLLFITQLSDLATMFKVMKETPPIPKTLSTNVKYFLRCCFVRNSVERPTARMLLTHRFVNNLTHQDVSTSTNLINRPTLLLEAKKAGTMKTAAGKKAAGPSHNQQVELDFVEIVLFVGALMEDTQKELSKTYFVGPLKIVACYSILELHLRNLVIVLPQKEQGKLDSEELYEHGCAIHVIVP